MVVTTLRGFRATGKWPQPVSYAAWERDEGQRSGERKRWPSSDLARRKGGRR